MCESFVFFALIGIGHCKKMTEQWPTSQVTVVAHFLSRPRQQTFEFLIEKSQQVNSVKTYNLSYIVSDLQTLMTSSHRVSPGIWSVMLRAGQFGAISRGVCSLYVVSVGPISIPGSGHCVVSSVSCLESLMSGTWSVASRGRGRDHCPLREETTPVLQSLFYLLIPSLLFVMTSKYKK